MASASSPTSAKKASFCRCNSFIAASCSGAGLPPFGNEGGKVVTRNHSVRCTTHLGHR
eukprot:CAMPEP_0204221536 /NCGR_PEP_ID=MMETSP0361-20130328/81655_1 /ASSEMBLY_ACC=CAM_ASM_000343 /TAXON_ID=268821 /ORGANISM="Scrippsiella Hangoei, Strain SHTV-5" /LENGTH=57 /DNA_ID=CAMNT_0051187029 /DNA_START=34 /DNA_END=204 /DNA_ORIENTATION=-